MKRKSVALFLVCMLGVGALTACGKDVKPASDVVCSVNGVDITRDEVSDLLDTAETNVLQGYVNTYLLELFYKDYEVNEAEVEAQFAILKGQVDENSWENYKAYLGYTTDEEVKSGVKQYLQRTKMLATEYKPKVTKTDEELKEIYDSEPETFNTLVLDALVCNTESEYSKAMDMLNEEGATLESVAESLGLVVNTNENIYESSFLNMFAVEKGKYSVGDIVYSSESSGHLTVCEIKTIVNNYESLKESVEYAVVEVEATKLLDADLEKFYEDSKVYIKGVEQ